MDDLLGGEKSVAREGFLGQLGNQWLVDEPEERWLWDFLGQLGHEFFVNEREERVLGFFLGQLES